MSPGQRKNNVKKKEEKHSSNKKYLESNKREHIMKE